MNEVQSDDDFRVVALMSAHNEDDVIYHVIGDLIQQGIKVYLLNHCSTDTTVTVASHWLSSGLLHIENFPQDAGYSDRNKREYIWAEILKRKQELACSIEADWFIHHDADEFRESPWTDMNLFEAIRFVDSLGYNAIDFELLNFRPINDCFVPGTDVRKALQYYEGGEAGNELQTKAWKKQSCAVDLVSLAGHSVTFEGRKVCPVKFILRHYPIRSQTHGLKKVLKERKARFNSREIRAFTWHAHYRGVTDEKHNFLYDSSQLQKYDPDIVRLALLENAPDLWSGFAPITEINGSNEIISAALAKQNSIWFNITQRKFIREVFYSFHDCLDMCQSYLNRLNEWLRRLN